MTVLLLCAAAGCACGSDTTSGPQDVVVLDAPDTPDTPDAPEPPDAPLPSEDVQPSDGTQDIDTNPGDPGIEADAPDPGPTDSIEDPAVPGDDGFDMEATDAADDTFDREWYGPDWQWGTPGNLVGTVTEMACQGGVCTSDVKGLTGATLSVVGGTAAQTGAGGTYSLTGVPSAAGVVVNVRAAGHAPTTRVVSVLPGVDTPLDVTLVPFDVATTLDGSAGGEVLGADGQRLWVPPNAFVDPDGLAVTGVVDVSLTSFDTASSEVLGLPGLLTGFLSEGTEVFLEDGPVMSVEVSQAGKPLQFAAGVQGEIDLPVTGIETLPDESIAWRMDENTGVWHQNGRAAMLRNALGQVVYREFVTHLSPHRVSRNQPANRTCIKGRVLYGGNTAPGAAVTATTARGVIGMSARSNGNFALNVPRDSGFMIKATQRSSGVDRTSVPIVLRSPAAAMTVQANLANCMVLPDLVLEDQVINPACPQGACSAPGTCIRPNLDMDDHHCGRCGNNCITILGPTGTCWHGACRVCPPGMSDCGGTCVNTSWEPAHCGGCPGAGTVCDSVHWCRDGTCDSCGTGMSRCTGANDCVNTLTSVGNCGSCNHPCNTTAGQRCVNGTCQ